MSLMEPGTYKAVTGGLQPYYRKNGRLSVLVKCTTEQGVEIGARVNIELNDETISERSIKTLRDVFKQWDGTIEGLFIEDNFVNIPCSIVVEDETTEDGKTYSVVKWLNPPGGVADIPDDQKADPKELAAKYGSKFRALAGPQATKAGPPAAKGKKAPPPPTKEAKVETMETCWDKCLEIHGKAAADKWQKAIELGAKGKEYDKITPAEWGFVMEEILQQLKD